MGGTEQILKIDGLFFFLYVMIVYHFQKQKLETIDCFFLNFNKFNVDRYLSTQAIILATFSNIHLLIALYIKL